MRQHSFVVLHQHLQIDHPPVKFTLHVSGQLLDRVALRRLCSQLREMVL